METIFTYVDGNGLVELEIPKEVVTKGFHCGQCDNDVEELINMPFIKNQLDKYSDQELINSLSEVWDDSNTIKNADRKTNEMRAVWIACGNIQEELYSNE